MSVSDSPTNSADSGSWGDAKVNDPRRRREEPLNRSILVLAFLGAVLVGFAVQLSLPATPAGRALSFLAFGVAFYPLVRALWLTNVPSWRYWIGLAAGTALGWTLDGWRTQQLSPDANHSVAIVVTGVFTAGLLYALFRSARKRT